MRIFLSIALILAGAVIGYGAPRPVEQNDLTVVRHISDSPHVVTAASRKYDTAELLSVKAIPTTSASCVDGEVSFVSPKPVFTVSNGYGGMNISYVFETEGGTIEDLHGAIETTEHAYGTYRVPSSWNAESPATYQATSQSGAWRLAVSAGQVLYRVHVTSPVDMVSEWYGSPVVSEGGCNVSTR